MPDVNVGDSGSVIWIEPVTEKATDWISENVDQTRGFQPFLPRLVCDHRYGWELVKAMISAGLEVKL